MNCTAQDLINLAYADGLSKPSERDLLAIGVSTTCASAGKVTPPCITPIAPTSAGAKAVGNTTILIGWSQPANTGSLITGYKVSWGTVSGVYTNNSGVIPRLPRLFSITGLTAGTQYFWVVQAVAFTGCVSAVSTESSATTTGSGICAAGLTFAAAWAARVVANGGANPSVATQNAIATFQCGLITDGLDSLMFTWNAFVPDNLIAAITPQLAGAYNDPWTNQGPFVLGDLSVNGLKGNASSKFLQTAFVWDAGFAANYGLVHYTSIVTATGFDYGGYNGVLGVLGAAKHSDNNAYAYAGATGANVVSLASPGAGFYSSQRVSTTDHRLYFAKSSSAHAQIGATDATLSGGPGTTAQFVFCSSLSGATQFLCSDTLSFVGFTQGLSSAQSAALYARVQTLRTALGGGFL